MHGDARGAFSQWFIRFTEPIVFGKRPRTLLVVLLGTLFFGYHASQLKVDAGFEKMLPLEHPYIQIFKKYEAEFGGANLVLFALQNKKGEIYTPEFMATLRKATDEVFFMPGVNRAQVQSLFTPNTRYIEVVEGGFSGGNVVPADYVPSEEMLAKVRSNTGKSGLIGRMVANDQTGAMIFSELLEKNPETGEKLDYNRVAIYLEEIRGRFASPKMYEYRLESDMGELKAGELVATGFSAPGLFAPLKTHEIRRTDAEGKTTISTVRGWAVTATEVDNPDYNPDVDIHIIGFAKVVGDISAEITEVVAFFGLTLFLTLMLLWFYCGSLKIAMIPLSCSVLAVVWELGMLRLFGYGLDPFAILVPFLVLAIGVSHGIQITSFWLYEVADHGLDNFEASRATYRRLVIPGISAVLTNVVGFATILLVPIAIVQEMAINAMFGLVAIIVCKKILLPCLLSYATLKDPKTFREHQLRRDRVFDPIWRGLSKITQKNVAAPVLIVGAMMFGWGFWMWGQLAIGELHEGVPELRPDSRYNLDTAAIVREYAIGADILKVVAENKAEGCIDHKTMNTIDRYAWRMQNTPGVQSTVSLPEVSKIVFSAYSEGNPKWHILPRESQALVQGISPFQTSSGLLNKDCSAMPIFIFTADHKVGTIDGIIAATKKFEEELGPNPPVHFALATGNVGVMAASNEVIKQTEYTVLFWVFLGIAVCVFMSFRSIAGLICVLVPLAVVSVLSYAVMVNLEIGLKVSTLPVAAFAAGIGVDYGIYIYSVLEECVNKGMSLRSAYEQTLHQTGKAVLFTALALGASVSTWLLSGLQFQVDMGILLTIMFIANALAAVLLLPAFAAFLLKQQPDEPVKA
jgi:predicted RND superfamily exporter protein